MCSDRRFVRKLAAKRLASKPPGVRTRPTAGRCCSRTRRGRSLLTNATAAPILPCLAGVWAGARRHVRARTSLPSAVARKLPSRCTSSDVTALPVSSVRTMRSARMSHTLRAWRLVCKQGRRSCWRAPLWHTRLRPGNKSHARRYTFLRGILRSAAHQHSPSHPLIAPSSLQRPTHYRAQALRFWAASHSRAYATRHRLYVFNGYRLLSGCTLPTHLA